MNTKAVQMSEEIIAEMGMIIGFAKTKKEQENERINLLSSNKKESLVTKYIREIVKRVIDVFAGITGLIILIPLTIIIYIANKVYKDEGPIFYTQERIGKNGKIVKIIKYRSMVIGAEEKLKEYLENNEEARKEYKIYKKLKNDPRITKIGKFLRKTSLDEMPQLLNLLTGEMSLIGPRPYLPSEREDMGEYYKIIIKNKPGITGLWQISGRSNTTFDERLDYDIKYYKEYSLKTDLKILYKTFENVIKKEGAI